MAPRGRKKKAGMMREDAARDAMRAFGFAERMINVCIKELLEVYGAEGWFLIEECSYLVLLNKCLEKSAEQGPNLPEERIEDRAEEQNNEIVEAEQEQNDEMVAEAEEQVQNDEMVVGAEEQEQNDEMVAEAEEQEQNDVMVAEAEEQQQNDGMVAEAEEKEQNDGMMAEAKEQEQNGEIVAEAEEQEQEQDDEMVAETEEREQNDEMVVEAEQQQLPEQEEEKEQEQQQQVEDGRDHVGSNSTSLVGCVAETEAVSVTSQTDILDSSPAGEASVIDSAPPEAAFPSAATSGGFAQGSAEGAKSSRRGGWISDSDEDSDSVGDDDEMIQLTPEPLCEELEELFEKIRGEEKRKKTKWDN